MRYPISRKPRYVKSAHCLLLASAAFIAAGCNGPKGSPAAKEDAVALLRDVLEAWQKGMKPGSLAEEKPPVTVADRAWESGAKLEKFEIEDGNPQKSGYDLK